MQIDLYKCNSEEMWLAVLVLDGLHFEQGLVDSDTLPLNVSREMLQQHSSLKTIKKKLIRKALDMIRRIAEEDPDEANDKDKKGILSVTCFF